MEAPGRTGVGFGAADGAHSPRGSSPAVVPGERGNRVGMTDVFRGARGGAVVAATATGAAARSSLLSAVAGTSWSALA